MYISPYSKDIKVFDAITSHPTLSKGVKHLVYDTARFIPNLSKDEYYQLLSDEFDLKTYYMKIKKIKNTVYDDLSALIFYSETNHRLGSHANTGLASQLCQTQSAFRKGYHQYCKLAERLLQLGRELSEGDASRWFKVVLAGLAKLGHIRSVSFGNSFTRIYDFDNTVDPSGDTQLYPARAQNITSAGSGEQESSPTDHSSIISVETLDGRVSLRTNGTRPVGSPLARSWPPYYLDPLNLDVSQHDDLLDDIKGRNSVPHGELEFCTILRLLKLTSKLPLVRKFDTRRLGDCTGSVPARVFNSDSFGTTHFLDLSKTLTSLDLGLADGFLERTSHDLDILRSFLQGADSLQSLAIHLPNDVPENDLLSASKYSLHKSTELLPHYKQWNVLQLRKLLLSGIKFTYEDFAGLFFDNLPQLKSLSLQHVMVTEGPWEDLVEGLSRLRKLSQCSIGYDGLLVPVDYYEGDEDHDDFWELYKHNLELLKDNIDHYVLHGGRHPYLLHDAPDNASDQYLSRLNETLRELRATHG
ncbi:MAG: hypothetical protein Q9226_002351 [Calogaya cf. arnoldii]